MGNFPPSETLNNEPCWVTPDLLNFFGLPRGWVLVGYNLEWLLLLQNSHHSQAYLELSYEKQTDGEPYPHESMEEYQFTHWEMAPNWPDPVYWGSNNQYMKLICMLTPKPSYKAYIKQGGQELMSMLAMKPGAIKQEFALQHTNGLYPTDLGQVLGQVQAALEEADLPEVGTTLKVLELHAGPAPYLYIAKKLLEAKGYEVECTGVEINPAFPPSPEADHWIVGSHEETEDQLEDEYHLIFSNPWFKQAGSVALLANRHRAPGGVVSVLVPIGFLFSDKTGRGDLFRKYGTGKQYILTSRPSFFSAYSLWVVDEKGRENNGTAGHEYLVVSWSDKGDQVIERVYWPRIDHEDPDYIEYGSRHAMVICALVREAAERRAADADAVTYDNTLALMTAVDHGWTFYYAWDAKRDQFVAQKRAELLKGELYD